MASNEELTVLVVDDDPLLRDLLSAVLSDSRLVLYEASDGVAALAKAREVHPDVILLDVMMPGMDGYATCRALRSDESVGHARIIILTARSGPGERDEAMRAGADAFFTKPFSPIELIDCILDGKPRTT